MGVGVVLATRSFRHLAILLREFAGSGHERKDSMINPGSVARRIGRAVILASAVAAAVMTSVGPFGARVSAQPPLEVLHERLMPIFESAGVVFTDADEQTGRLVIGVLDRDVERVLRARIPGLGLQSRDVDIIETDQIVQVATLRDSTRPVVAGVQVRYSNYVCSLGFNALRNGVAGFVIASHCSTKQGSVDATKYYQPLNQVPGELIGMEIADPSYQRKIAGCPPGKVCRYSDSNFVDGADGVAFTLGSIAKTTGPNNLSLERAGSFTITGEAGELLGDTVNKVGRTTGWGQGVLTRTCVHTGVSSSNIVLLCQNFVENADAKIVEGGDSGAPVFKIVGGDSVSLLGNLWGGNTDGTLFVYSPLSGIENELGPLTTR
jgi:hypothetical protein